MLAGTQQRRAASTLCPYFSQENHSRQGSNSDQTTLYPSPSASLKLQGRPGRQPMHERRTSPNLSRPSSPPLTQKCVGRPPQRP
jgi:hypothetical protein